MTDDWWTRFFEDLYGDIQIAHADDEGDRMEVDVIDRRLGLTPGAAVLDVPCGAGRHAIELARRGYRVTAVDFHARVVDEGRRRAAAEGLDVDYRVGDMRDAPLPTGLDGAFCWFGSFGYFDDDGNRTFLAHVASALRPGARLAIDTVATETLYPRFRARDWRWLGEGEGRIRSIEEREYDVETATLRATWTRQGADGERRGTSRMRLYAYRELKERFHEAGFEDVQGFDGLTDAPFGLGASRLTIVGRRAG